MLPRLNVFIRQLSHIPKNVNYFDLFGIKPAFKIDAQQLKNKFRRLQDTYHPDRFATKSEEERNESADTSSLVNKAYQTLSDSHARGLYLLKMNGHSIPEESDDVNMDSKFLEKMMEINEKVTQSDAKQVAQLIDTMRKDLSRIETELEKSFASNNLDEAQKNLIEFQFYRRILERLKNMSE